MRKLLLVFIVAIFAVSCTKKTVILSGNIRGASPLDRVEIIEISNPATLPIANFGVDAEGNFSDTIELPKEGVYAISYGGMNGIIYLKRGEHIQLHGQAGIFPSDFQVSGNAGNNLFLQKSQSNMENYFSKLSPELVAQKEPDFLKQIEKFKTDLSKSTDSIAKANKANNNVLNWKQGQIEVILLSFMERYAALHGRTVNEPNYKVSKKFTDYEKVLTGDETEKVKTYPDYRQFLLSKIGEEYQQYAIKNTKPEVPFTQTFINFLKEKKYPSTVKDYLISFVASSVDMRPDAKNPQALGKILDDNIENSLVKNDMHKIMDAVFGKTINTPAPNGKLKNEKGESIKFSSFKGKPTLLVFYTSWIPNIGNYLPGYLKQISDNYKDKLNLVLVNLDDNFAQFKKTSAAMMKDIPATNLYPEGGLQSQFAKDYAIYGFNLPNIVVIDKNGNIASSSFMNFEDPDLKSTLDISTKTVGKPIQRPQIQPAAPKVDTATTKTNEK